MHLDLWAWLLCGNRLKCYTTDLWTKNKHVVIYPVCTSNFYWIKKGDRRSCSGTWENICSSHRSTSSHKQHLSFYLLRCGAHLTHLACTAYRNTHNTQQNCTSWWKRSFRLFNKWPSVISQGYLDLSVVDQLILSLSELISTTYWKQIIFFSQQVHLSVWVNLVWVHCKILLVLMFWRYVLLPVFNR